MKKVELLAPAGNLECLKVAVNNGADAVYIGGLDYSARAYANNFTKDEIIEGILYAHIRNVKVYVTINTMIYNDELDNLLNFIDFLYLQQVDALIVSDFGLINVLKLRYPDLAIHISTQMNTNNLWQIKLFENLNVRRIILARETELSMIKYLIKNSSIEIEVFAHGALCICYSGNCLQSSMIGKRSGNRGKCAQPCRMEYTLLENGKAKSNKKYLLSMKDLNVLEHLDELIESGVASLKIEGRMKSKEYVAFVIKTYREAIDQYYIHQHSKVDDLVMEKMKMVYSRGFTKGYLFNESNAELTNTYRPSPIGNKVGMVVGKTKDRIQIKLMDELAQKDKIVIVQDHYDDIKMYISKIFVKNKLVPKGFKDEIIEIPILSKVLLNATIYKMIDNHLQEEINQTIVSKVKRIPIRMKLITNIHEPMTLIVKDNCNHSILVKSDYIVQEALQMPTKNEKIKEQLSKLNDTAYTLLDLHIVNDEKGFIPVKYINELRRNAIKKMDFVRTNIYKRRSQEIREISLDILHHKEENKKFKVKVHSLSQLEAIFHFKEIDAFYYDDLMTYKIAKEKYPQCNIIPVMDRINSSTRIQNHDLKSVVINHYGDLYQYENARIITDLYMNVVNEWTITSLYNYGVESITLSSELNRQQILQLIEDIKRKYGSLPPLEMVVYGHYQTMMMKHCFISKEYGFKNKHCGVCKNKTFALLDRMNYVFPITTNEDCNVTIYNSKAIHLIQYISEIYAMGIISIRLDFTVESPQETYEITKAYLDALNHRSVHLNLTEITYGYYLETEKN